MGVPVKRIVRRTRRRLGRFALGLIEGPLPPPRRPDPDDADPIGTAARARPPRKPTASDRVMHAATQLFSTNGVVADADAALARILGFVEVYAGDERLQVLAGRMLERSSLSRHAARCWTGISERFPGSHIALARRIGQMSRGRGAEAAHSWLLARFPSLPSEPADLSAYAAAFSQINEYEQADLAHEVLLRVAPRDQESYLLYAKSLERRGEYETAARILAAGRVAVGGEPRRILSAMERGAKRADALARVFPELGRGKASTRDVLDLMLAQARSATPGLAARTASQPIGGILLIGGSLAAGGAERQFVQTALHLQKAVAEGRLVRGQRIAGPVSVICQSLTARDDADFFLGTLISAGIEVVEMSALPAERGRASGSAVAPYLRFLDYVPTRIVDGVLRLSDFIRERAPEIVHIWQDGMVLTAGAAALIAGAPRIVLSARTMPPVDRLGRKKPEYQTLYRGLLARAGVTLTANSCRAARRYADWLDLPLGRVRVVRNGVVALPVLATVTSSRLATAFDGRTEPDGFTLGCVMRFDENKRPAAWLAVARRVCDAVEHARFILVGDGPLFEQAKAQAAALGIEGRVLFTGRSPDVGYWLSRMSLFLLLSHIEGLPNVLIEAQLAGLPVVTTPAGGASECIRPETSGVVLPSADLVDPDTIAAEVIALAQDFERRRSMAQAARAWAETAFSVEAMLGATIEAYTE